MSRNIKLLHPKLQAIIPVIIERCAEQGLMVLITDGFRSEAEQTAIYAQGRTKPGKIVSNARYPYSAHNWGVAVDFCRNVRGREYDDSDGFFRRVANVAKNYGLEWGGDWTRFVDKPHLQLAEFMPNNSTTWLLKTYGSPQNFRTAWEKEQKKLQEEDENRVTRYRTVKDAPEYARRTLYKLMQKEILLGDGNVNQDARELDISEDMVRVLVWLDRAGAFDKKE